MTEQSAPPREGGRAPKPAWARVFPLDDINVVSRAKGGDGRTVEAYAAVFDVPAEISDRQGRYLEKIHRGAFDMTINSGAAKRAMVLYNHGLSVVDGRPMAEYGVPLGSPVEVRADGRGLLTRSRYNTGLLADSVLEAINNGDVKGYSFRGSVYRSNPDRVPAVKRGGQLPTVVRMELGLRDFGPTPAPYYPEAEITAVRSHLQVLSDIQDLPESERMELIRALTALSTGSSAERPDTEYVTSAPEADATEPRDSHSARLALLRIRAAMVLDGV